MKQKHLTLDERTTIAECLSHGMSFKTIARRVGKDQTTVSKEIKKHIVVEPTEIVRTDSSGTTVREPCPLLCKVPFVCNPCPKRHRKCLYDKHLYVPRKAQATYEETLRQSREGIPLNREAFYEADRIITEGIEKGQHLYHILQTHSLPVSQSSVYRHLHKGYLTVSPIKVPRVVKFRPRAKKQFGDYIPKALKVGRTYADFQAFLAEWGVTDWLEMDTVIGTVGGKVIMTLHFTACHFMTGLLLDNKSACEAAGKIKALKSALQQAGFSFGQICPLLLTDNGGEFADVLAFENNNEEQRESHLFFCDPCRSSQKPNIEKNHTLFRDIVPKGRSFDGFTQDTVNLIFSHVNCVRRHSLNGKSPFDLFAFTFGEHLANRLGCTRIPAEQVVQSPVLLTK